MTLPQTRGAAFGVSECAGPRESTAETLPAIQVAGGALVLTAATVATLRQGG